MTLDIAIAQRLGDFALDVAFTADTGRVTALFGASGAGKSATVRAIAGMSRPTRGHIRVAGETYFDHAAGTHLPPERRGVGYVFQDAKLFPHLSVRHNLLYGWRRAPAADRRTHPDEVIDLLGIAPLLDRRPHALSGGERQRVALGRALLAQPRLLLMDEPLAALDAPRRAEILPFIERLRDELDLPILYVSHAIEEVVRLADNLVVLADGKVLAAGPLVETMRAPALRPVLGAFDYGAVLEAEVAGHDTAFALTMLATPAANSACPAWRRRRAPRCGVRIRARDTAVALDPPNRSSVVNVLTGTVASVEPQGDAGAMVRIVLGETGSGTAGPEILAAVTRYSAERLGLAPGLPLYALIKAVALDRNGR